MDKSIIFEQQLIFESCPSSSFGGYFSQKRGGNFIMASLWFFVSILKVLQKKPGKSV